MKADLFPFYKEREFTLNTTPEQFAAWLQKHVKAGLITPPGAKIHIGIAQFTPPPNIGPTARLKIHGYIEKPDPEEDGAYLRSHLPGLIQFELISFLTREGIEVRAECHDPALMEYFDELLAKIERGATLTLTRESVDDKRLDEILTRRGNMDWDVFISHAWEDKEDIARLLAEALRRKGLRVWYDELTLTLGDSLRRSIDRGLAQSRYGVVILSPHFFAKEWPQRELDGLAAREVSSGKVILPVWHNVTWEDVRRFSPTLADKLAVSTAKGLDAVVEEILRVLRVDLKPESAGEEHRPRPLSVAKRTPAKARRPVNWERVGTIAGVIAVVIASGAWLVANASDLLSAWLSKTPTVIPTNIPTTVVAVTKPPTDTPTVTPTSSPTHTPVISTATPTPPTPTLTPRPPTRMPVVLVPAGGFTMGSDEGEHDEQPVHTLHLNAFYMDKTEVTNAQYRACVEAGTCNAPSDTTYYDDADYAQHPVVFVSWTDADAYCQWTDKRLPTEAEWEKAARGIDGRIRPWGEGIDCDHAQYIDCGGGTASVGSKPKGASPYGALDMVGNVAEWVADWYDPGYYSKSPARNPHGPDSGGLRVLRGGSWSNAEWDVRCAARDKGIPGNSYDIVGFRCARGS